MGEKILVCVAWPYASSKLHIGNIAGADLPPDILARYHRLKGNEVLMVSGSDSHGTPVAIKAAEEGESPHRVFQEHHEHFLRYFQELGLSYDLFTHTDTENHRRISQDILIKLLDEGYLFREEVEQLYCKRDQMFLPDRYVTGTCPFCGNPNVRGDQCEVCGHPLDATELINPVCKLCGQTPVLRKTEHLFLDLPQFEDRLLEWVETKAHWRPNVVNFTRNYLRDGLEARAVTRDMEWGVPVPVSGFEDKVIYVWFEAVIGYLSASIEWASNIGQPEKWKEWWYEPTRSFYFIAKDNIPFHTIIWPAILMGVGQLYEDDPGKSLNLPYDVPSNEFMNLEGRKISGSRNWAVWLDDILARYDPDPIRYYLTAAAPETRDTDFTWEGFLHRNNNELVATWGNLVHRVLTFAYRRFDQRVPKPDGLDDRDRELLSQIEGAFLPAHLYPIRHGQTGESIGERIDRCQFRDGLGEVMALAREVNRYLEEKAPWFQIKEDRKAAATTLYVALRAIDSLKVLFAPFLPFSSQRLHEYLGYEGRILGEPIIRELTDEDRHHRALCYDHMGATGRWAPSELPPGQVLQRPQPLFKKLKESIVEEELARIGAERG
ncbi:MAG: methionine--tRNA ligase [Chloroflexota bacterium]|nr:methionine--tRNA ligase [Chloroflexota bacterium]